MTGLRRCRQDREKGLVIEGLGGGLTSEKGGQARHRSSPEKLATRFRFPNPDGWIEIQETREKQSTKAEPINRNGQISIFGVQTMEFCFRLHRKVILRSFHVSTIRAWTTRRFSEMTPLPGFGERIKIETQNELFFFQIIFALFIPPLCKLYSDNNEAWNRRKLVSSFKNFRVQFSRQYVFSLKASFDGACMSIALLLARHRRNWVVIVLRIISSGNTAFSWR